MHLHLVAGAPKFPLQDGIVLHGLAHMGTTHLYCNSFPLHCKYMARTHVYPRAYRTHVHAGARRST